MRIRIPNPELRRQLNSAHLIIREYGAVVGKILIRRICQVHAAKSLADLARLPQVRIHPYSLNGDTLAAVNVDSSNVLVLKPDPNPTVDWSKCTEVSLLTITEHQ